MDPIVVVENFSKSFGGTPVIKDLNFEVGSGEIFAFLGANGSGKTTTIRCLLRIYEPDQGKLLVDGKQYLPEHASILGYLPEERGLYTSSNVLETIVYFGRLKGLSRMDARKSAMDFLKRVGLEDKSTTKIQKLSSGQQQKIQLGITVINRPKLLILDEPTKGLDPVNRGLLLDILLELNKEGSTILFSTHQMDEAERIADRLLMIKNGQRALYGSVDDVKRSYGENSVHVAFNGSLPSNEALYTFHAENHAAMVVPNDGVEPKQVLQYLVQQGVDIREYRVSSPSLNEIFIKVSNDEQ